MLTLLFIDDDDREVSILSQALLTYLVIGKTSGTEGLNVLADEHIDVVLLDLFLPDMSGFTILSHIRAMNSPPPVVILSGHGKTGNVVKAMQLGARNFIEKPYTLPALLAAIENSLAPQSWDTGPQEEKISPKEATPSDTAHQSGEKTGETQPSYESRIPPHSSRLPESNTPDGPLSRFIGSSKSAHTLKRLVKLYASNGVPVLLIGESGTGKEVLARAIHELSPRRDGPFIPLNAGAIPHSLIESELYGSSPGAFTDAISRPGYFEQADGGTLFLDEIGEMPLEAQAKFLRILEERSIVRVGGRRRIPINVRVVCATNRPLERLVAEGTFRRDLFYRINTLTIPIPPLRRRHEDIGEIAFHLFSKEGVDSDFVSDEALQRILDHDWPGNTRELENVIKKAVILAEGGRVEAEHILFFSDMSKLSFGENTG